MEYGHFSIATEILTVEDCVSHSESMPELQHKSHVQATFRDFGDNTRIDEITIHNTEDILVDANDGDDAENPASISDSSPTLDAGGDTLRNQQVSQANEL